MKRFITLLMIFIISAAALSCSPSTPPPEQTTTEPTETTPKETVSDETTSVKSENQNASMSFYPTAVTDLHCVAVKWGRVNNEAMTQCCSEGRDSIHEVEYVGIEVEFVRFFSDFQMSDSIRNGIEKTTWIFIPKNSLYDITEGESSVVFLKYIKTITNENGKNVILGVLHTDWARDKKLSAAPILNIIDGKVIVPNKDLKLLDYAVGVMLEANSYIQQTGGKDIPMFRNGMTLDELAEIFDYMINMRRFLYGA